MVDEEEEETEESESLVNQDSPNPDITVTEKDELTKSPTKSLGRIAASKTNLNTEKEILSSQKNNDIKTVIERKKLSNGPDNQTLLRLLEQGEQLHSMFRCARIQGLDTIEGLLLFGRDHYYVVDGFTLLKTREIRDLDFLPEQ